MHKIYFIKKYIFQVFFLLLLGYLFFYFKNLNYVYAVSEIGIGGEVIVDPFTEENIKYKSTVTANPDYLEPNKVSTITITIIGTNNLPLADHKVSINITGCFGIQITQPRENTNSSGKTYGYIKSTKDCIAVVHATDITYLPTKSIDIQNTATVVYQSKVVPPKPPVTIIPVSTVTIDTNPKELEPGETSIVTVTVYDKDGIPIKNKKLKVFLADCPSAKVNPQTAITNDKGQITTNLTSNLECKVKVLASDIDKSPEIVLNASDYANFVFPELAFKPEPEYTKGTSNTVYWTIGSSKNISNYEFFIQLSKDPLFKTIEYQSTWVSGDSLEFKELKEGQKYYYKIKLRNKSTKIESRWATPVFSTQDASAPVVSIDKTSVDGNIITVDYSAKDTGSGIEDITVYIQLENGELVKVGTYKNEKGQIQIDVSKYFPNNKGSSNFKVYLVAKDKVGNESDKVSSAVTLEQKSNSLIDKIIEKLKGFLNIDKNTFKNLSGILTTATGIMSLLLLLRELPYFFIYLQNALFGLFSSSSLLIEQKNWGVVYNAKTKEPISRAILRLYDSQTDKLIQTIVSSASGIFSFKVKAGIYKIKVFKQGFIFPSSLILGKEDVPHTNVYHGEILKLDKTTSIDISIPMDNINDESLGFSRNFITKFTNLMIKINKVIFYLGFTFAVIVDYLFGGIINIIVLGFYVLLSLINVLQKGNAIVPYGCVKNEFGVLQSDVEIGIYETQFDQLIDRRFSDMQGEYRFILPNQDYVLKIIDPNYQLVNVGDSSNQIKFPVKNNKKDRIINMNLKVKKNFSNAFSSSSNSFNSFNKTNNTGNLPPL